LFQLFIDSDTVTPPLHCLEKNNSMTAYSAGNLETIFKQWIRAAHGWQRTDAVTLHSPRSLSFHDAGLQDPFANIYELLFVAPGGRWLVQFRIDGSAFSYDVASTSTLKRHQLMPLP
jgi:hypothetical protein